MQGGRFGRVRHAWGWPPGRFEVIASLGASALPQTQLAASSYPPRYASTRMRCRTTLGLKLAFWPKHFWRAVAIG